VEKWNLWGTWKGFTVRKFKKGEENYSQPANAKIRFFILIAAWAVAAIVALVASL